MDGDIVTTKRTAAASAAASKVSFKVAASKAISWILQNSVSCFYVNDLN